MIQHDVLHGQRHIWKSSPFVPLPCVYHISLYGSAEQNPVDLGKTFRHKTEIKMRPSLNLPRSEWPPPCSPPKTALSTLILPFTSPLPSIGLNQSADAILTPVEACWYSLLCQQDWPSFWCIMLHDTFVTACMPILPAKASLGLGCPGSSVK